MDWLIGENNSPYFHCLKCLIIWLMCQNVALIHKILFDIWIYPCYNSKSSKILRVQSHMKILFTSPLDISEIPSVYSCPYRCPNKTLLSPLSFKRAAWVFLFLWMPALHLPPLRCVLLGEWLGKPGRINAFGWITCQDNLNFTSGICLLDSLFPDTTRTDHCF